MGKNVDKVKGFLETLKKSGHLRFIVENGGSKHRLSNAEIKRMGLNPVETEKHLIEVVGEKAYVSHDSSGIYLKEGAGPKVYSCCQRLGLNPYSNDAQVTESMSEPATDQASRSDEISYPQS